MVRRLLFIVFVFLFIVIALPYWYLIRNGKHVYQIRTEQVNEMMRSNPAFFQSVFDDIYPKALECHPQVDQKCTFAVRSMFDTLFAEDGTSKIHARLPMYFIRLEDDKLVKLFFSGNVKVEEIDTSGEKAVREVLQGKRTELYGIQANQDGLKMQYLKDFDAEGEVIVPYRENGEIVGAVVFLHGD